LDPLLQAQASSSGNQSFEATVGLTSARRAMAVPGEITGVRTSIIAILAM
jgi:hypothetical protein